MSRDRYQKIPAISSCEYCSSCLYWEAMSKIHVIQFMPYFPPHPGGLESHASEFAKYYTLSDQGKVVNVVFSGWQEPWMHYYERNGYQTIVLPAFDLVPTFPFPKFRKKSYRQWFQRLKSIISSQDPSDKIIVLTRTRFFLSSLLGALYARHHHYIRVHAEHGSDYVKLSSRFKTRVAKIYDRTIGRRIFRKADALVPISYRVDEFIQREFVQRDTTVIHRGMDFAPSAKQIGSETIRIWFVGRLVALKWVDLLIKAFNNLSNIHDNLTLSIIWDGEDATHFKSLASSNRAISFLWSKERDFVAHKRLPRIDILVNPSYVEWLPTTVLEWLLSGVVVVATDVGGTDEITTWDDLIIVEPGSVSAIQDGIEYAITHYRDLQWLSQNQVRKDFDWSTSIEKYFRLFEDL